MRNIRFVSGQVMAVAASLLLVAACGGGGDDAAALDPGTGDTTSSTQETTTTTSTTTTSTVPGTVLINGARFANFGNATCLRSGTVGNAEFEKAVQGPCNDTGDPAAYWKVTQYGETFTLQDNRNNNCLAIENASTEDLAKAAVVACDGSPNTLWKLQAVEGTTDRFALVNTNSNKCLEWGDGAGTDDVQYAQYTCGASGQANQTWIRSTITP